MIEDIVKYHWYDYIDRIIPINGYMNGILTHDSYWNGYKVYVRYNLEVYESVYDWQMDGSVCDAYIYRHSSKRFDDIIIPGFENAFTESSDSPVFESLRDRSEYSIAPRFWLYNVVKLSRKRFGESIPLFEHIDMNSILEHKMDSSSDEYLYLQSIYSINENLLINEKMPHSI